MKRKSTTGRKRVRFQIEGSRESTVYVSGSFNDWNPQGKKLRFEDGVHSITMLLPPGQYEYKFFVDGAWCVDPKCSEWVRNDFGSLNSVIAVG